MQPREHAHEIAEGELNHRQIMTIVGGLLVGMFLASLDGTIVTTAIRTIGDDLHGLSYQAWVTTAFLITATLAVPVLGKLSDIYGRKRMLMISIVIFVLGSMLCGLSQSMYMLAAFRAVQGIGAGGILPLSMAVVGDIMSPRMRGRYQGYFVMAFGVASVVGPVIGGFFAGAGTILGIPGWRWIFYINVPLGILALLAIQAVLPSRHVRKRRRIDWWGTAALIVGVVPLLVIAEQGRELGFTSPIAIACYLLGLSGLVAFVWVQKVMGEDAIIPLHLFKVPTFSWASAQSFIIGTAMFGGMAVIPLYLQIVRGATPTQAGLLLVPLVVGMMLASWINGQYMARTGTIQAHARDRFGAARRRTRLTCHDPGRYLVGSIRYLHLPVRRRRWPEHAGHGGEHAERRRCEVHGCLDLSSDFLAPDRWCDGGCGLSHDLVQSRQRRDPGAVGEGRRTVAARSGL